jgi:hypothetical protein
MFQKINAIADKIERLVNRANYVFAVVNWSIETFRLVANQLRTFPTAVNEQKENDSLSKSDPERAAGSEEQQPRQSGDHLKPVEGENIPVEPSKV